MESWGKIIWWAAFIAGLSVWWVGWKINFDIRKDTIQEHVASQWECYLSREKISDWVTRLSAAILNGDNLTFFLNHFSENWEIEKTKIPEIRSALLENNPSYYEQIVHKIFHIVETWKCESIDD